MTCRISWWLICSINLLWPLFFLARGVQTVRKAQTLKKKMVQNKTCLIPVVPTQKTRWRWTSVSVSHLILPSACVDLCWNSPWDTCHFTDPEGRSRLHLWWLHCFFSWCGNPCMSLQRGHCTPLGACAEEERRPQLWKDEPVLSFVESWMHWARWNTLKLKQF